MILECAFIESADAQKINTEEKRRTFAAAYSKGILKTLGIAYKGEVQTMTTDEAKKIIMDKAGLDAYTIQFLGAYKYGEDLMVKLAKAMR